jgi:AcrR family transcriptional regulator
MFKPTKGALRKIEIIEAALCVIASEGIDRLTFESVGQKSRIGKSHVAYHFPNREELVKAVINYVYTTGQATVVECLEMEKRPERRLQAYIRGTFQWIESHPNHIPVIALLLSFGSVSRSYRKQQTKIRNVGAERIYFIVKGMKKTKKSVKELKEISETIQAIILGNVMYYGAADTKLTIDELSSRTYRMALKLLNL